MLGDILAISKSVLYLCKVTWENEMGLEGHVFQCVA